MGGAGPAGNQVRHQPADGGGPQRLYPQGLPADESVALDFTWQHLRTHGVADSTYQTAQAGFGDAGLVELTTLVGFSAMCCCIMNVARTPAPSDRGVPPLSAFFPS
jgi:4-carboxymuconolactone decarboxylase